MSMAISDAMIYIARYYLSANHTIVSVVTVIYLDRDEQNLRKLI